MKNDILEEISGLIIESHDNREEILRAGQDAKIKQIKYYFEKYKISPGDIHNILDDWFYDNKDISWYERNELIDFANELADK